MPLTFDFEKSTSPIFGTIHRPVVSLFLFSSAKQQWYETLMIVDTGADFTLLPRHFMTTLGISTGDCTVSKTTGIGGARTVSIFPKLRIKLGQWERVVPVGFLHGGAIPPLAGRHLFLETFHVCFSKHQVLFENN